MVITLSVWYTALRATTRLKMTGLWQLRGALRIFVLFTKTGPQRLHSKPYSPLTEAAKTRSSSAQPFAKTGRQPSEKACEDLLSAPFWVAARKNSWTRHVLWQCQGGPVHSASALPHVAPPAMKQTDRYWKIMGDSEIDHGAPPLQSKPRLRFVASLWTCLNLGDLEI